MKGQLVRLIIFGLWFFSFGSLHHAQAAELIKKSLVDSQPIEITADRLEANDEKKVVLFSGNAIATQGNRVIKAEKIWLYYKKDVEGTKREVSRNIGTAGDLERIEAKGQVSITQSDRVVTGEQAIYNQDTQRIVMTGNAVMRQGNNIVHGDKIEVFLDENRGVVEAAENKRVKATIYPIEKQEEKK